MPATVIDILSRDVNKTCFSAPRGAEEILEETCKQIYTAEYYKFDKKNIYRIHQRHKGGNS